MPLRCTLHVGAPKTGSSSIQDAFFFDLRNPGFHYACGGDLNGSVALTTIYETPPDDQWVYLARGWFTHSFEVYRSRFERGLKRAFRHAVERRSHLIISGESAWLFSRDAMIRLRDELQSLGFDIQVVAYVRPWASWNTSILQQTLKSGRQSIHTRSKRIRSTTDVKQPLERFFDVFGREQVSVHLFAPSRFPGGCVVRHFCEQIGFPVPDNLQWRSNETLSLPAAQLMFAYNRYGGPVGEFAPPVPRGYGELPEKLQGLTEPKFQLHSSLLNPLLEERVDEDAWLQKELGISLLPDRPLVDAEHSVATDDDMINFSPSTLEWLAKATHSSVIKRTTPAETARAVAMQMDQLRQRPITPWERLARLRKRLRTRSILFFKKY